MKMKKAIVVGLWMIIVACGRDPDDDRSNAPHDKASSEVTGALLYDKHCRQCHGKLSDSTKKGKSASTIEWALMNVPAMSSISLTEAEIAKITEALEEP